jgi:DNA-binding CsgD family transcriptional regulator
LNRLRPHVSRAYRHAQQLSLIKRALPAQAPMEPPVQVTSVLLDAEDRPVQFGALAQQWLSAFFGDRPKDRSCLPDAVTDWLRRTRSPDPARPALACSCDSLVRERDGRRLRLRVIPALSGPGRILLLGLETVPEAAHASLARELTPREIEVLLQVEQGKTNEEVAVALGISPLTVRTHLEHIFEKLRVPSRTAAVTQFRHRCWGCSWEGHFASG